jgi:hypothetical protein
VYSFFFLILTFFKSRGGRLLAPPLRRSPCTRSMDHTINSWFSLLLGHIRRLKNACVMLHHKACGFVTWGMNVFTADICCAMFVLGEINHFRSNWINPVRTRSPPSRVISCSGSNERAQRFLFLYAHVEFVLASSKTSAESNAVFVLEIHCLKLVWF